MKNVTYYDINRWVTVTGSVLIIMYIAAVIFRAGRLLDYGNTDERMDGFLLGVMLNLYLTPAIFVFFLCSAPVFIITAYESLKSKCLRKKAAISIVVYSIILSTFLILKLNRM